MLLLYSLKTTIFSFRIPDKDRWLKMWTLLERNNLNEVSGFPIVWTLLKNVFTLLRWYQLFLECLLTFESFKLQIRTAKLVVHFLKNIVYNALAINIYKFLIICIATMTKTNTCTWKQQQINMYNTLNLHYLKTFW